MGKHTKKVTFADSVMEPLMSPLEKKPRKPRAKKIKEETVTVKIEEKPKKLESSKSLKKITRPDIGTWLAHG